MHLRPKVPWRTKRSFLEADLNPVISCQSLMLPHRILASEALYPLFLGSGRLPILYSVLSHTIKLAHILSLVCAHSRLSLTSCLTLYVRP